MRKEKTNTNIFRHREFIRDLKRHFRPDLEAENINTFDPALQGFRAFEPDTRPELAKKYAEKFPRTPVDWDHTKMGQRINRSWGTYNQLAKKLQRERSGEDLPSAKSQKTLQR